MISHRKWHHRSEKLERRDFDDAPPIYLKPLGYFGPPYVERIDEKDEHGNPQVIIWLPLGAHGEVGMQINSLEAQTIVDGLREALPPDYQRIVQYEVGTDWPGIR